MALEHKIALKRIVVDPAQPPEAAHAFVWARVGGQFLLEVGFFDMLEIHGAVTAARDEAKEEKESPSLIITRRYVLSPEAVSQLSETVDAMMKELPKLKGGSEDASS